MKSFGSNQDISQPSLFALTSELIENDESRPSSQSLTTLSDNAEYDSTIVAYPMTQNVVNVDDRITKKYDLGLEQSEKLDNANSQIPFFPSTTPTVVDVCDTDQVEVTSNHVQVNAFSNGTRCSVLVTTPNTSTAISVKLLKSDMNNVFTYFYTEHLGILSSNCSDRFVLVPVDHFPCVVATGGNEFRFHFQNVKITVEIAILDLQILPCLNTGSPVFQSKQCNITSYATKMGQKVEQFEFTYEMNAWPWKKLNVNVSTYQSKCICDSCKHTLGNREWLSVCIDGKDNVTRLELIVYQPGIKGLSFADTGLHKIQPNAFLGLEGLEVLILEHNSLSILPYMICQNLPQLKVIKFGYNMLTNLTSDFFKGQCDQNLLGIYLNNNKLTYLAQNLFNSTIRLKHLDLSQNKIIHISNETFNKLILIETLHLQGNYISDIPNGVFDSLELLRTLDLRQNHIASIPVGAFDSLGGLRYLGLSDNRIVSLLTIELNSLGGLWTLELSDNNISSLPAGVFNSSYWLSALDLSDNRIASLPENFFDSFDQLRTLNLSDNHIAFLPADAFNSLGELAYLDLSDNNIAFLPAGVFDQLGGLTYLDLSNNRIASLPLHVFDSFGWLRLLLLSDNQITSLPCRCV